MTESDPSSDQSSPSAASWISLQAGPLDLSFDRENLSLRYVRLGDREILRSIYGAVRDRNWGTVRPQLSKMRIEPGPRSFQLEFEARCREGEIDFIWTGTVTGTVEGEVRYVFEGQAESSFWRSRIGLCVLHPLDECAGRPCRVEHVDGTVEEAAFPRLVSPHQPFLEVRALTHEVLPGLQAEVRFAGDVFETEDQRNWTDASFKTYSTRLHLPFPVRVERGTRIRQEVRLTVNGSLPSPLSPSPKTPTLTVQTASPWPRPPIGLCVASHNQFLTSREISRLKQLRLSHLRADLRLGEASWRDELHRATHQSQELDVGLHLALHLTDQMEAELDQLLAELAAIQSRVLLWLVFHVGRKATPETCVRRGRKRLARFGPDIPIAAGTDAYFAEINRAGISARPGTLPCYSINPQVHGNDDATLVENLGGQADTVETAWRLSSQPVVVSPITLRPRFNPNATAAPTPLPPGELPPEVDVRQLSPFCAGWTVGSIAALAGTGHVHSLTYYETTGWRGVMEQEAGSSMPDLFPSRPGAAFPVFEVFAALSPCARLCPVRSSDLLSIVGLGLIDDQDQVRVLIANLRNHSLTAQLRVGATKAEIHWLTSDSLQSGRVDSAAAENRIGSQQLHRAADGLFDLELPAFACAQVELIER